MNENDIEQLAQAVHAHYRVTAGRVGITSPIAAKEWDELTPGEQEANRAQARDIPGKLLDIGLVLVPAVDDSMIEIPAEEIEALARIEHNRWMDQKIDAGWVYDPVRDDTRKRHHLLVAYDELSEAHKELDREAVRQLPELLKLAGFTAIPG